MERCRPQSRSRVRRNLGDNNVGRYIHETFGYDVTFVIGRDDRTRYATIDGELRTADAFELAPGLEQLIARARAISPDQPGAVSAYLRLDGAIAIFGASPITPETTDPIAAPQGPRPVLVYAELLDGDGVLNSIAETLRLHNLHVLPPQAASAATLPLTAPDGTKLGGLAWQPPPLGRELIRDLVPSLLLAFGLIAGFTWFVLNHARKTARTIEAGEARFRDVAEASADWIWETDAKGRLVFVSERFAEVMGLTPQNVLMRPLGEPRKPRRHRRVGGPSPGHGDAASLPRSSMPDRERPRPAPGPAVRRQARFRRSWTLPRLPRQDGQRRHGADRSRAACPLPRPP